VPVLHRLEGGHLMPLLPADAPPEFGKGAIQAPPDPRDLQLGSVALEPVVGATALPASYILPGLPPVTNQGATPECTAYSSAYEQNWQDRREFGRFFNFDEHRLFSEAGGGPNGAVLRNVLEVMRNSGYPEQDATPERAKHQITAYASITKTTVAIKQAIIATGGVLVIGPWWPNWEHPLGPKAVLPSAEGQPSGHAWWSCGWDGLGIIGQNTWGTQWGDAGKFRMPWAYALDAMWDFRTTIDDVTLAQVARGVIREQGTYIRNPRRVTGSGADPKLTPDSIWGQARKAGIWRRSTDSIVATPWDKPFKYGGRKRGTTHGIGKLPDTWALLGIAGTQVALPAALVRLVV
jgi:hypothetical protein